VLAHADREVCATWTIKRKAKSARLELTPVEPLSKRALKALEAEGLALLADNEPGATDVAVAVNAPAG
jgi:hypothetical protein